MFITLFSIFHKCRVSICLLNACLFPLYLRAPLNLLGKRLCHKIQKSNNQAMDTIINSNQINHFKKRLFSHRPESSLIINLENVEFQMGSHLPLFYKTFSKIMYPTTPFLHHLNNFSHKCHFLFKRMFLNMAI